MKCLINSVKKKKKSLPTYLPYCCSARYANITIFFFFFLALSLHPIHSAPIFIRTLSSNYASRNWSIKCHPSLPSTFRSNFCHSSIKLTCRTPNSGGGAHPDPIFVIPQSNWHAGHLTRGGYTQFFGGHVLRKLSIVGSTEQIFFPLKNYGLGNKFFTNFGVFGAEILPKSERNGPKNAEFFKKKKKKKMEGIRTDTRCKKVGLWSGGGV